MFCEISTDDQSFPLDSSETPVYNDERKEENEMKCNVCGQLLNNKTDYIEVKKNGGISQTKIRRFMNLRFVRDVTIVS